MTCGIYKLTFPSGKVYIGQSINIEERWREHKSDAKKCFSSIKLKKITKLFSAFKKYGWEEVVKDILDICLPEELNEKEIQFISIYDSFNHGLNCTTGGFSNFSRSDKTKQKLREINLGRRGGIQSIPFYIDDIRYVSILDASSKLGIPHKTIYNRLNSKNIRYSNYRYENKSLIPERQKRLTRPKIIVIIDGIIYESINEASRKLNISTATIMRRAKSNKLKFSNYKLV